MNRYPVVKGGTSRTRGGPDTDVHQNSGETHWAWYDTETEVKRDPGNLESKAEGGIVRGPQTEDTVVNGVEEDE